MTALFSAKASMGLLVTLLVACGGGGSGSDAPSNPAPTGAGGTELQGVHVTKLRAQGAAWIAVASKPRAHEDNTAPDRYVLLAQPGVASPRPYFPPAGWSLIDAALHPSGEASVVLAAAKRLRLVRLSAQAQVLSDAELIDPLVSSDPIFRESGDFTHDSSSMLPFATRDAVRIAAAGESLVMALRTGRHAVVAYGLRDARPQGYAITWRTLVEPGVYISAEAFLGGAGTFDPFEGMENQFHVALDTDVAGRIGIAVSIGRTELVYGHRQMYPGSLPDTLTHGVLVTQLTASGQRIGTVALDTHEASELHGLRWVGSRLALLGRVRSELREDGSGWNGFVGLVAGGANELSQYTTIDIDRGDVIFDAVQRGDGRLVLSGSTGYVQNPSGRSISEEAAPLVLVTAADGSSPRRQTFAAGPRHNQARALAHAADKVWVAGMEDGPGTHSDDADPSQLRSSGYVRAMALTD